MDGISRIWNWTESTLIKATSRAIFGLSPNKQTELINEKSKLCSSTSSNLKPVYDILNSGSRNRFTVLSDSGPLIVHNCGFGGSIGAFSAMGRVYGVRFSEQKAKQTVDAWRRANPWAVMFWQDLERAYMSAMRHPGHEFTAGRITYVYDKQHLWYMLPSGRVLCYPFAKFEGEHLTYAKASWKPAADATEWPRARLWGGLACENVTQASAHDILRAALRQCDGVVAHVHDEIVIETAEPEKARAELERIMVTPPDWAVGLPLAVEVKVTTRYSK
jgi:DNA polymerase